MALFSQILLKDGCILDHLAAIDASMELGKLDSKSLIAAIKGIKAGELALKELMQMNVFLEILSNAILSNPVPDVQAMSTLPSLGCVFRSLASTLDRHRKTHPKIVEDSASKMWMCVRDLFEEGSSMRKLPVEIQQLVYEFDPTYHIVFDKVMQDLKKILARHTQLQFKKKYQRIFGSSAYAMVHRTCAGHIRVASIEREYEGCNSVLLEVHKVLLFMQVSDERYDCSCRDCPNNGKLIVYAENDWERFHSLQGRIEDAIYENEYENEEDSE
jgi:hypothetical protein